MWNKKKKALIVLSGPSGAGKSSLVQEMLSFYGSRMGTTTTYTTRQPRGAEKNGKDYYFISKEEFQRLRDKDFFVEWAYVYRCYYGTSAQQIENLWAKGRIIIKDFDLKGAESINKKYPQCLRVFIMPPSKEELLQRLYNRKENKKTEILYRSRQIHKEIREKDQFDCQLENNNLKDSVEKLKKIIEEYLQSF